MTKTTRLTRRGHSGALTRVENQITFVLMASGTGRAIRRRELLALVGGFAVGWPFLVSAQQPVPVTRSRPMA
jgi:hypothetical protein